MSNCPVNCPLCADEELEEAHNRRMVDDEDYEYEGDE